MRLAVSDELEAAYLDGHPEFTPSCPTPGRLVLRDEYFCFEMVGEHGHEPMFAVAWSEATFWAVEGSNAATQQASGRRVLAGAHLAGAVGALLGGLAKRAEFEAALIVEVAADAHNRTPKCSCR